MRLGWPIKSLRHVFKVGALRNALVLVAVAVASMVLFLTPGIAALWPPYGHLHPPQLGALDIDII
jgi:hypothetical protein